MRAKWRLGIIPASRIAILYRLIVDNIHLADVYVFEIAKCSVMDFLAVFLKLVQALKPKKSICLTALNRIVAFNTCILGNRLNIFDRCDVLRHWLQKQLF